MQYSTFLIDLDHTLFDSDASEQAAFAQALGCAGIEQPARYTGMFQRLNLALWAAVERGEITPQVVRTRRFEQLAEEASLDFDPAVVAESYVMGLANNGGLYAGARAVLEFMQKKASLALVTNGLSEVQRSRIRRLGIDHFFDAIVISAEVGAAKPGREIFDITFAELAFPEKKSTLMVGDSLTSDIRGGSNYGVATCWYNPHRKRAGSTDRISHEINKLSELPRFIDGRAWSDGQ